MATLGEIRSRMLDRGDNDPAPSTDFVRRVNGFINDAYMDLVDEVPFLFFEEEIHFRVEPPLESGSDDDTVEVYDQSSPTRTVVEAVITTQAYGATGTTDIPGDRTLDGRVIELLDSSTDEVVWRSAIGTVYTAETGLSRTIISLKNAVRPSVAGEGPWKWRIYSNTEWLQNDILEIRAARLLDGASYTPLEVRGQTEAEDNWLMDEWRPAAGGPPRYLFRRGFFQLRGPSRTCLVAEGDDTDADERWLGPEPGGTFSYRYTYTWGKRDPHYQAPGIPNELFASEVFDVEFSFTTASDYITTEAFNNRMLHPRFESAPSPASAEITTETMDNASDWAGAIKLTFPNISYQLGTGFAGATGNNSASTFGRISAGLSGIHVRIYRRRHAEDFENYDSLGGATKQAGSRIGYGASAPYMSRLDFDDSYYLLAEIPIEHAQQGVWWDRGEITPDYAIRCPNINGYEGIRWYPPPDDDYEVAARVLRRPEPLVSDSDAPRITEDANSLLIYRAQVYYFESLHEYGAADRAKAKFEEKLEEIRARRGDLRPDNRVTYRKPARSLSRRGMRYKWWKRGSS